MLQVTRRNALTAGDDFKTKLRVLKMYSDVVEGSAVARCHNSTRAALAQRSTVADCERHEIVNMSHDRIAQIGGSQSALLQCRLQINHEKS